MKRVRITKQCFYTPPGSKRLVEVRPGQVVVMTDEEAKTKNGKGCEYLEGEAPIVEEEEECLLTTSIAS